MTVIGTSLMMPMYSKLFSTLNGKLRTSAGMRGDGGKRDAGKQKQRAPRHSLGEQCGDRDDVTAQ